MGQRLNIEILSDGQCIANCYFHWSAYTGAAICQTLKVIDNYVNNIKGTVSDPLLAAVRSFSQCTSIDYSTGTINYAGLSEASLLFMKEKYKDQDFNAACDRNAGLIGCVEEDMEDTRSAEEGRVTIDLDNESVSLDVLWIYQVEDYIGDMTDSDDEYNSTNILNLPVFRGDIENLTFEQFKVFASFIDDYSSDFISTFGDETCIVSLIE